MQGRCYTKHQQVCLFWHHAMYRITDFSELIKRTNLQKSGIAYYSGIRDGWYSGSGCNFKFGTRANITLQSWSMFLQLGKAYGQNFKNNLTLPFYAELSLQKRF
jgi:hypothetical protein